MLGTRKVKSARYDVIVAGGGFAGGVLALALGKLAPHSRVALVDAASKDADERSDARGLALSAASKMLLDAIGLWSKLEPEAQAIESIEITDSALNARLRPHLLGFDEEMKAEAPRAYLVEAGKLLQGISHAIASETSIDVFAPDSVTSHDADTYGVHARLDRGET